MSEIRRIRHLGCWDPRVPSVLENQHRPEWGRWAVGDGRHLLLKRGWASALKVELSVGQWSRKQCLVASVALKRVPKANVVSVTGCWPWDFKGTERTSVLRVPSSRAAHGQTALWPSGHGDHPDPDLAVKAVLLACFSLNSFFFPSQPSLSCILSKTCI